MLLVCSTSPVVPDVEIEAVALTMATQGSMLSHRAELRASGKGMGVTATESLC